MTPATAAVTLAFLPLEGAARSLAAWDCPAHPHSCLPPQRFGQCRRLLVRPSDMSLASRQRRAAFRKGGGHRQEEHARLPPF